MATIREVERMIRGIRECDELIKKISDPQAYDSLLPGFRQKQQATLDAMIGGLIERKHNLTEALLKLNIIDEKV